MAELVDALDLGSSIARCESSSLSFRTIHSMYNFGANMQFSIDKNEGLERNLTVSIPAEDIKSKVADKLKEISKQVKIKGFRPGRVPNNVLNNKFGKHARQEVLGEMMNSIIQDAVKEHELSIAEAPQVTEAKDLDDGGYSFKAKLEVLPEIPEIDFSKVKVKNETAEVDDNDVDGMIAKLQKQKQEWKDSKAAIKKGDLVTIEYVAKKGKKNVHPEEGKEKMGILLGESGVPDELVSAIVGMKIEESKSEEIEFPEAFNVKPMAGQKLKIDFEVVSHKRGKLPKVDEEFVKSFGVDSGKEEDLRNEIADNLKRELKNVIQAKNKTAVLKALREEVKDLAISDKMIARESAALAHQSMEQARQMGIQNPPHPDHKNFEGLAKERILNSLLISNIAKKQNVQVDYTKVREKIIEISQTFENPSEIVEYYYKTPELLSSIEGSVLENQVIDWVTANVDLSSKKVSFDKIMESA